jgi:diguanylate cyclase (GGDEF)-like protein
MTSGNSFHSLLDWSIRASCLLVACVGCAVLCGWIFDVPALTRVLPGLAFMKISTASALIAASAALWLLHTRATGSAWLRLARMLALCLVVLGGLILSEHLFDLDLGIDQHIGADRLSSHAVHFGRVSPATGFNLTFLGLALLTLKARRPFVAACAHWLVVPPLLVSGLAVLGYFYGFAALYEMRAYSSMAAHTAAATVVLNLAILAADSGHGFAGIASSDTAGGLVSRRLLPTIPIMLVVLGWVCLEGEALGLYSTPFRVPLLVLLSTTLCLIAVATTAITLHKVDLNRKRAEAEILSLNVGLELRVRERTQELAQVSAQLQTVNGALELLSQQDGLTGVANRRFFDTYLADQINIARRYGRTLALVLYDVDAFKAYNDHYGHHAGDECLKRVAATLRLCCRRTADRAARFGGEEFAMVLPDTGLDDAVRIAEAARQAVAQLNIVHENSATAAYVTLSGGVAVLLDSGGGIGAGVQQLIMDADQSLYEAKRLGRNRIVSVRPVQDTQVA